jgi:hypothetical protein
MEDEDVLDMATASVAFRPASYIMPISRDPDIIEEFGKFPVGLDIYGYIDA